MIERPTPKTLLEDLEDIRQSLDKIAKSQPQIPTLEEIVGRRTPTGVNPQNPFLSSQSLSELIRIRNEAEARSAQEMANMEPIRSLEEILAASQNDKPAPPQGPDPEQIIAQLEDMFDQWVEHSVKEYLAVFESELRNRLQQDFRVLVTQWYEDHELPIPDSFQKRQDESDPS